MKTVAASSRILPPSFKCGGSNFLLILSSFLSSYFMSPFFLIFHGYYLFSLSFSLFLRPLP